LFERPFGILDLGKKGCPLKNCITKLLVIVVYERLDGKI
jgi:hypothetical protein